MKCQIGCSFLTIHRCSGPFAFFLFVIFIGMDQLVKIHRGKSLSKIRKIDKFERQTLKRLRNITRDPNHCLRKLFGLAHKSSAGHEIISFFAFSAAF